VEDHIRLDAPDQGFHCAAVSQVSARILDGILTGPAASDPTAHAHDPGRADRRQLADQRRADAPGAARDEHDRTVEVGRHLLHWQAQLAFGYAKESLVLRDSLVSSRLQQQ